MKTTIVNKSHLVEKIAVKTGLSKTKVDAVVSEVFNEVKFQVKTGNRVRINSFVIFEAVMRKGKKGNDISRNRQVIIPAHKVPVFRASQNFKKKIK